MSARVLVVDDIMPNLRILEAKLESEYYEVLMAQSGLEAIEIANSQSPDIILLDVMMPDMDGFETCRRLKAIPATNHIPVVMVTALDERGDLVQGLEAGADDFLMKPVDDITMFARVKSLTRLKFIVDELKTRQSGSYGEKFDESMSSAKLEGGNILVVDDDRSRSKIWHRYLADQHNPFYFGDDPKNGEGKADQVDLLLVNCKAENFDGLRVCSHIRSEKNMRQLPLLAIIDPTDKRCAHKALDLGVNDLISDPVDPQELGARIRTQMKRKHYLDYLRKSLDKSVELAGTDPLTGLNNRRVMENQLEPIVKRAVLGGPSVSLMLIDLDHFKSINDTYGHDAGDEVLVEFSKRLRESLRIIDIPCRFGGEEFVVVMPNTNYDGALAVAQRVLHVVGSENFVVHDGEDSMRVTASIGLSTAQPEDNASSLLKRVDECVYKAKDKGRNRVIGCAPKQQAYDKGHEAA